MAFVRAISASTCESTCWRVVWLGEAQEHRNIAATAPQLRYLIETESTQFRRYAWSNARTNGVRYSYDYREVPVHRIFLLAVFLPLAGCINYVQTGPTQHQSKSIPLDKSELVHVNVTMGAGDVEIRGGAAKLLDADFTYNVPSWQPIVQYDSGGSTSHLRIEQPHGGSTVGNSKYSWDLRFNDTVPLDFNIHFGAGEGRLDLGTLDLRGVNVNMGVGQLTLDLRGTPKKDYDVSVHGGVGECKVYLPNTVGLEATASGGIGEISVRGLTKNGGRYTNDLYDTAKVRIHIDVHGGVGQITLVAD